MTFVLFMGDHYYPCKPKNDMIASFASEQEAVKCMNERFAARASQYSGPDWAQILDTEMMSWNDYAAPPYGGTGKP